MANLTVEQIEENKRLLDELAEKLAIAPPAAPSAAGYAAVTGDEAEEAQAQAQAQELIDAARRLNIKETDEEDFKSAISAARDAIEALVGKKAEQHTHTAVIAKSSHVGDLVADYNREFKGKSFYEEPNVLPEGPCILKFENKEQATEFLTEQAKLEPPRMFLCTEVGKGFDKGPNFYSCGDGKLYTGSKDEITQKMNTALANEDDSKQKQIIEAGIKQFAALTTNVTADFKEEVSSLRPPETGQSSTPADTSGVRPD